MFREAIVLEKADPVAIAKLKSHSKVGYQDHPMGDRQCSVCAMFVPGFPPSCTYVAPPISTNGYCDEFEPHDRGADVREHLEGMLGVKIGDDDSITTKAFDPNEPRDERGRWTSNGDSSDISSIMENNPNSIVKDHVLVDRDAFNEAVSELRGSADLKAIPALDPNTWDWTNYPIILRADGSVLDGNHRIIGVAKWMESQGMNLDDEYKEIPALSISEEIEETHPSGESTPEWWIKSLVDAHNIHKMFDPGEQRDDRGRWTDSGTSGGAATRAARDAKQVADAEARVKDLQRQLREHSQDKSDDLYWALHHALQQTRADLDGLRTRVLGKAFDPSEPRDERGMWTAEGGGISSDTASKIFDAADISNHFQGVEDAHQDLGSAQSAANDAEEEAQGHLDEHGEEDPALENAAIDAQQSAAEAAVELHRRLSILHEKTAAAMRKIEQHLAASGITRAK